MIVDGEERHYTAMKGISRLLSELNGKTRRAYHFCMNCNDGFRTRDNKRQQETSIMSTAAAMVTSKLICPVKKKNFTIGSISLRLHLCCMQTLKVF